MARIRILPDHEARKIAAGEVIERPASVVKELLENALDAGATEIVIMLRDGGKAQIIVTDNGCGMSPEDARLCVEHHATSKIASVDELTTITTFGFRGEALSSIAAVSQLSITTRRAEDASGYNLSLQAGTIQCESYAAANRGTTMRVDDLFMNLPARRRFLKQRDTELRAVQQLVTAYALIYPYVRFELLHDGVALITAPPATTLLERAQQLVEYQLSEKLLPLAQSCGAFTITGVVSNHQYERYDRRSIYTFVNRRWVKNTILSKGIMAGYMNVLASQKFPYAMVALTIPPEQVDINIHPRKEEVLLQHPHTVSTAIAEAVRMVLTAPVTRNISPKVVTQFEQERLTEISDSASFIKEVPMMQVRGVQLVGAELIGPPRPVTTATQPYRNPLTPPLQPVLSHMVEASGAPQYTYLGQLAATYLLLETAEGLSIIDQHAAHESVRYAQVQQQPVLVASIALIFPEDLICADRAEYEAVVQLQPILGELGIMLELEPPDLVRVVTTNRYLVQERSAATDYIKGLVHELLEEHPSAVRLGVALGKSSSLHERLRHACAARIACTGAVKAGDRLTQDMVHALLASFFATPSRLTCPHGRPTLWKITTRELERFFKRTV